MLHRFHIAVLLLLPIAVAGIPLPASAQRLKPAFATATIPCHVLAQLDTTIHSPLSMRMGSAQPEPVTLNYPAFNACLQQKVDERKSVTLGGRLQNRYRLRIDTTGKVSHVCHETVEGNRMDADVLQCAMELRFEPATYEGRPVPVWVAFPVRVFELIPDE